jgi:uncharacterized protein (DUF305 family)
MNKKLLPLSAVALAAALSLAGCATDSGTAPSSSSMTGMHHGSSSDGGTSASAPASAEDHNMADVMFARMMIPHHAQAVEMSDMILAKQDMPADVRALATRIKEAQGPEIELMTGWLEDWKMPAHLPSGSSGHGMAGMMGAEEMKKLDDAQGTAAARLFLEQMIIHHDGAIVMAKSETADGKSTAAVQLGKDIVTAQEAEIQEMRTLLGAL